MQKPVSSDRGIYNWSQLSLEKSLHFQSEMEQFLYPEQFIFGILLPHWTVAAWSLNLFDTKMKAFWTPSESKNKK